MKAYISKKAVHAEPMTNGGREDGEDGYKVLYSDGFKSWTPKHVFERCFREITEENGKLVIPIEELEFPKKEDEDKWKQNQ